MAAQTRGRTPWEQTSTLGRYSGRVVAAERGKQMKDLEYHRRQLQRELQSIEDEYKRLGSVDDTDAWGPPDDEPRTIQVNNTPPPRSSSPGVNKRASWAGYDDKKTAQNYYGTGPGSVGTMPRQRTSLVEYKAADPSDRFKVDIDVKEFNPEDVRIKLEDDGGVCVEARRQDQDSTGRFSTLERRSKVKLPTEVDRNRLSAIFSSDDGILTIQAPKRTSGTSTPSSQGPQSPNFNIAGSPSGQTIIVQPTSPMSPQTDIPYADEAPSIKPYPMYDSQGPIPRETPNYGSDIIPYYIDKEPHPQQARGQSPTKREPSKPIPINQPQRSNSPAYSPRPESTRTRSPYYEPQYSTPKKSVQDTSNRPKTSTPEPNRVVIKPAIRNEPSPMRGRQTPNATPSSPRRAFDSPDAPRSASLPRQKPAQVQQEILPSPEKGDSLPPPMGRMTISFTLGRGFTPDQVIVKNIMNYNKFMVMAKADPYSGRKSFRHIFNWPCPINPATIYAFLKKDGVLHVSCMPLSDND